MFYIKYPFLRYNLGGRFIYLIIVFFIGCFIMALSIPFINTYYWDEDVYIYSVMDFLDSIVLGNLCDFYSFGKLGLVTYMHVQLIRYVILFLCSLFKLTIKKYINSMFYYSLFLIGAAIFNGFLYGLILAEDVSIYNGWKLLELKSILITYCMVISIFSTFVIHCIIKYLERFKIENGFILLIVLNYCLMLPRWIWFYFMVFDIIEFCLTVSTFCFFVYTVFYVLSQQYNKFILSQYNNLSAKFSEKVLAFNLSNEVLFYLTYAIMLQVCYYLFSGFFFGTVYLKLGFYGFFVIKLWFVSYGYSIGFLLLLYVYMHYLMHLLLPLLINHDDIRKYVSNGTLMIPGIINDDLFIYNVLLKFFSKKVILLLFIVFLFDFLSYEIGLIYPLHGISFILWLNYCIVLIRQINSY